MSRTTPSPTVSSANIIPRLYLQITHGNKHHVNGRSRRHCTASQQRVTSDQYLTSFVVAPQESNCELGTSAACDAA